MSKTENQSADSGANKLVELVANEFDLIHSQTNAPFAVSRNGSVRQIFNLRSQSFFDYIVNRYYRKYNAALSESTVKTALVALSGRARYDGGQHEIFSRVGKSGGSYWLDLCNPNWAAVEINESGWTVRKGKEVPLFERSSSMQALPTPMRDGNLDDLWGLLNIPLNDRLFVLVWVLECLRSDTPYVVLEIVGEQGSAKSSSQGILKKLIDPNGATLRTAPKSVEDIWIGARNSHVVSFENISQLPQAYQDAMCVLATGGAYATRTLYSNTEESIIQLCRPIVINGITVSITAQDLADRCMHIEFPKVQKRVQDKDLVQKFADLQPWLLGAILDQFVLALRQLKSVTIPDTDIPRMADFAYLGEAVFQANGCPPGEFTRHYKNMRRKGVYRTIEASPIGQALLNYLADNPQGWEGQLSDLLEKLWDYKPRGEKNWPTSGKGVGDALRRLKTALSVLGFDCISNSKVGGAIRWEIKPFQEKALNSRPVSSPPADTAIQAPSVPERGHAVLAGHERDEFEEWLRVYQ
jgi:hypothetical protein